MSSCLETKLCFEEINFQKATYPAIILAAGSATRMKGIDKNFTEIGGRPVVVRTVEVFDNSDDISEIILVTRSDKTDELRELLTDYSFKKQITVTAGGSSREESALLGIKSLGDKYSKVIIHDGARPFVEQAIISRICEALKTNDSVSCGVPEKSTIKVVNEDWQVVKALRRASLVSLQTPQGVAIAPFLKSASVNDLAVFTDDTSVVEAVGVTTQIVEGSYKNIKITTPEDIVIAEAYLKGEAL